MLCQASLSKVLEDITSFKNYTKFDTVGYYTFEIQKHFFCVF